MKTFSVLTALTGLIGVAQAAVQGFDISHYQSSVNFAGAYSSGARFVIIKVSSLLFLPEPFLSCFHSSHTNPFPLHRPPKEPPTSIPSSPLTTRAPPPPA